MNERLENGVRARRFGQGDMFAFRHREMNGIDEPNFHMNDVDGCFGYVAFGQNLDQRLFLEYEPDAWENRESLVRRFGVVAMFDRKRLTKDVYADDGSILRKAKVSLAFYLYLCRAISKEQGRPCRFFYVFGGYNSGPWLMRELDIATGEQVGVDLVVEEDGMRRVWTAIGLDVLRSELHGWLNGG